MILKFLCRSRSRIPILYIPNEGDVPKRRRLFFRWSVGVLERKIYTEHTIEESGSEGPRIPNEPERPEMPGF
jgi:hypothetical protein